MSTAPGLLFEPDASVAGRMELLAPGASVLRGFALEDAQQLLEHVAAISRQAPFRHMATPNGLRMSVAMTNCGALGWVTDRTGYRYDPCDPESGAPWPQMPAAFARLAAAAAQAAGFRGYRPDACLVNRYVPGARLSLHQDRDELDFTAPIVSVSLGVPAVFLFGGLRRADRARRVPLAHGDVVVWGGPARLTYHGVLALKPSEHPSTGEQRFNLTFRKAS